MFPTHLHLDRTEGASTQVCEPCIQSNVERLASGYRPHNSQAGDTFRYDAVNRLRSTAPSSRQSEFGREWRDACVRLDSRFQIIREAKVKDGVGDMHYQD